jgi:hypothetical protein
MRASASSVIRLLRFLGKAECTIALLLGGAAIMTVGTILESRESREVARSLIYAAAWFDVFLFLIVVNLVAAVINRIPIKRHQWSFVVVHFSIVLLLTGAWVSRTFGYEGRMAIHEGGEESRLFLDSSEIRARWYAGAGAAALQATAGRAVEAAFPLPQALRHAGRRLQEEGEDRPGIRIVDYIRDGFASAGLGVGGEGDKPGVRFLVTGARLRAHQWLIGDSPRFGRRDVGPVDVEFVIARSREMFERRSATEDSSGITLLVPRKDGGATVRISLPASVGKEIPLGPDLIAKVEKLLLRARVVNGELTNVPRADLNPAVIVEIASNGRTETHTVFSKYPDFDGVHGRDEGESLVGRLRLDAPSLASKPLVAIILGPDQQLHVQLSTAVGRDPAVPVPVGQSVALGDLGLALEVESLLESARPEITVHASSEGRETGDAFIRLEASRGGRSESHWLPLGSSDEWILDGHTVEMTFVRQTRPLPFAIALDEFELIRHPGSSRPAEYRSLVTVKPISADLPSREAVISMNRPLDVAGFRLFQSSYQLGQGRGPDLTVLSVSYDPGVPIVYLSFGLIVLGIAWYVRGHGRRPKPSARASSRSTGHSVTGDSALDPRTTAGGTTTRWTGRNPA